MCNMNSDRLIIAGGRDFDDYELLSRHAYEFTHSLDDDTITVISGGAKGADSLGERWAAEALLELVVVKAEWDKHGKAAGPKRNQQMAELGTHLLAFWDGQSKGTRDMIDRAVRNGLWTKVVRY